MYDYILDELKDCTLDEIEAICQFDEWARDNRFDLTPEDVARGNYAHELRANL